MKNTLGSLATMPYDTFSLVYFLSLSKDIYVILGLLEHTRRESYYIIL